MIVKNITIVDFLNELCYNKANEFRRTIMSELYGTKEDVLAKSYETVENFFKGKNSKKFYNMIAGIVSMAYNAGIAEGGDFSAYQRKYSEGYTKGYETAQQRNKRTQTNNVAESYYEQGVNDAWECACKAYKDAEKYFGCSADDVFGCYYGYQALDVLQAYEAENKIQVGDEIKNISSGNKYIITYINSNSIIEAMSENGRTYMISMADIEKTGRHFSIENILEQMRTEQ